MFEESEKTTTLLRRIHKLQVWLFLFDTEVSTANANGRAGIICLIHVIEADIIAIILIATFSV